MNKENVVTIINDFLITNLEIDPTLLKENAVLTEDLKITSLDFVDIAVCVKKNFNFQIFPADMKTVKTLGDFYQYVLDNMNPSPNE